MRFFSSASAVRSFPVQCLLSLFLFLSGITARADVVLLLEDPINFLGHVSSTGHAALLVDDLCSDDHLHMRLCRPREDGSVISRYKGINGYDWLAMPPGPYLFAVDSPDEVPATASIEEVAHLRAQYRANHPGAFASSNFEPGSFEPGSFEPGSFEPGNFEKDPPEYGWVQLLGAAYRRRMICIRVHTTREQDLRLMNWLNRRSNRTQFNFFFSNCADFTRQMLNVLFPGSIHRNLFFDLGMTTPKQLQSSLHHYAKRHPELEFAVYELPQIPGNIPRSGHLYGVTESFAKSKPYLLPVAVLDPIGIGSVAALGIADHRYQGKTNVRAESEFFFRPEIAEAAPPVGEQ
jgi:hypothetical protein